MKHKALPQLLCSISFLSSLSNYIWGLFFLVKYAYNTSSFPIPHCVDKIISLYHVWGDQRQAKHIAEPTVCLVGTLRSLWGQKLVILLVICKRYMKQRRAEHEVLFIAGSLMGPSMERRCQEQDDLGAHLSCWKQADEIKTVVSICAHSARSTGKSQ